MATPVFKFNHPDFPEEDLFFIQNTFYEEPATIPMDLSTFVYYHLQIDRTLEGFFECWDDIMRTGSSLNHAVFDTWFTDIEKAKLYEDAVHSDALYLSKINKESSNNVMNFINQKKYKEERIFGFLQKNASSAIRHFKAPEYYNSRHELADYFWANNDYESFNQGDQINHNDLNNEQILISLYEICSFPLTIIPHKFRKTAYFKSKFIEHNLYHLLPGVYTDKNLILELLRHTYPHKLHFYIGDELSNDRNFIREAIKLNGGALGNASETLRNDKQLVLESLYHGWAYASDELKYNRDIIISAIEAFKIEFGTNADISKILKRIPPPMDFEIASYYDRD